MRFGLGIGLGMLHGAPPSVAPDAPTLDAPADASRVYDGVPVAWSASVTEGQVPTRIDLVLDPGGSEVVVATDSTSTYGGNWTPSGVTPGAHTLVARFVYAGGNVDSAAVDIVLWEPMQLAGLKLWYDPAEGVTKDGSDRVSAYAPKVTTGTNKSANQVAAGQNPLWEAAHASMGDMPVLTFDKTRQDQLYNPGPWDVALTNPHTWVLVGRVASYDTAGTCPVAINANCYIYADGTDQRWGSGAEKIAKARIAAGTPFVQVAVFDNAGEGRFYENALTAVATGQNTGANTINRLRFGNFVTPVATYDFDGQMGDFLIFEGAMSDADVASLLTVFGAKYGIAIGA